MTAQAQPQTHRAPSASNRYAFVLPGTWASIPLGAPEEARRVVRGLVRSRAGRDDRLAAARRLMSDELLRTAERATAAGAEGLWLALDILPGIPMPGSLMSIVRPLPGDAEEDLEERLRRLRPTAQLVQGLQGPFLRTSVLEQPRVPAEGKRALSLEYVVPTPWSGEVLVIDGSAPLVEDAAPYLLLFDSIVDSLRWSEPV